MDAVHCRQTSHFKIKSEPPALIVDSVPQQAVYNFIAMMYK